MRGCGRNVFSSVWLDGVRNTSKNLSLGNLSSDVETNPGYPGYETGLLTARQQRHLQYEGYLDNNDMDITDSMKMIVAYLVKKSAFTKFEIALPCSHEQGASVSVVD
jgi:hypothetical protein